MTKINLLPWREERRQELKQQFFVVLFGVLLIGAGSVYLVDMGVQTRIEYQNQRNQFIVGETKKLEQQIKEIEELKKKRESLIERMKVIQDLQGNRPEIVKVFDEMVRTLPDGVYYKRVKATGDTLSMTGLAESNNRVSNLMRNLDASELFEAPNLSKVQAASKEQSVNEFDLTVKRQKKKAEEEG
ncbi:MAG: pilus assembly protein PilN [Pseudomonadales bacterium]|jgi:type IV pilus assembly protein PilN|nr:pilus assembly protein PilN [Pseudomonadales bacterium]MAQ24205.1 pilus assembly protein PilN [Pseudomonadales bacterium]MEC8812104.1 PilN domain-containing protein [Pseudomonadota bacterium]TNC91026.1 MAG: pilus assembly protein PilN [Alcanivorax sp.]|tara:strand:+ start:3720 stop:4277 length:558 start_codon:yes stop_codon:yes gene_type:complete